MMLVPQSLAYALLAGLPAQSGLFASILPLVAYAAFGSSRTLAVGPIAVISLMTASALAPYAKAPEKFSRNSPILKPTATAERGTGARAPLWLSLSGINR